MSFGSSILLNIFLANQFSGKTYFYTIASRVVHRRLSLLLQPGQVHREDGLHLHGRCHFCREVRLSVQLLTNEIINVGKLKVVHEK